jgi:methionyl-tRNA formyltransferase
MKIVIITQNDPFYLSTNLKFLLDNLPEKHQISGVIVASASPFGKRETFFQKAIKTKNIFGLYFFLYYSVKFVYSKLFKLSLRKILKNHNIPEINIEGSINSKNNLKIIQSYKPDLLVSILGNQIFKKPLLELAPKGCINLHTALLPKYRGLMPSFWVLKNKEKYTGVSVFLVDEGIDSGPIIVQEKIEIGNSTQQSLIIKTKRIGMQLILKSIDLISKNHVALIPNDSSKKTYYTFPTRKDVIEFKKNGKFFF